MLTCSSTSLAASKSGGIAAGPGRERLDRPGGGHGRGPIRAPPSRRPRKAIISPRVTNAVRACRTDRLQARHRRTPPPGRPDSGGRSRIQTYHLPRAGSRRIGPTGARARAQEKSFRKIPQSSDSPCGGHPEPLISTHLFPCSWVRPASPRAPTLVRRSPTTRRGPRSRGKVYVTPLPPRPAVRPPGGPGPLDRVRLSARRRQPRRGPATARTSRRPPRRSPASPACGARSRLGARRSRGKPSRPIPIPSSERPRACVSDPLAPSP